MTTGERLAKLEEKTDNIERNVGEINAKLDKFIEAADQKYASKATERIVFGMASAILLTVLYVVLESIGLRQ